MRWKQICLGTADKGRPRLGHAALAAAVTAGGPIHLGPELKLFAFAFASTAILRPMPVMAQESESLLDRVFGRSNESLAPEKAFSASPRRPDHDGAPSISFSRKP